MNITPGIRLGDFEIAAPLGKGGMGEVFKARDTHLGREVAIKLLPQNVSEDPEMLARFDREAKVLAALSHPGIAVLFGFEKHELPSSPPVHYLVMELVSGETLADRLARGKMSLGDTLEIFTQIADALDAAHEKGIVHRDLKPANIMLSNDTTVKILDFGLARSFTLEDSSVPEDSDEDPEATAIPASPFPNLTGTHQILGTPAYMSPEQARGLRVDRRTDIWAFGCCLFEALTGTLAFQGATTADILKSVLAEHPPLELLPPHTPPALVDLVERCVRKDARERLRDVGEAWVALRELSGHSDPYTVTLPVEHNETGRLQRLSINLYPDPQIDTFDLHFELAPDSSVLAYTGMQEERRILTLRALDSISPVTVPATKGVNLPFFSPDSNWIGFFGRDPDRLMRVSMSGGDPLEICRVDSMLGGCWFSDGSIVIGGGPGTGLQRIDPESGESVRILTDPEYDHWSHVRPVCTPGERFVLFECRTKSHKKFPDIHILDLSDGSARPLVRHARQPVCPRDDLLVCQQLSGLVGFPLDQESRRVTGNPIAICEPHMPREVMEPIVFSLNRSGDLAYLPEYEDDRRKFRLVWVTQDGKETAANLAPNHYVDPCLSPDGTEAVVAVRTRFGIELRVADLVRGAIHPVEQCDAINFSPYWLNHSEDILYASSNGSTWQLRRQKIGARNFDVEWEGTDLVWVVNGTSDDKTF